MVYRGFIKKKLMLIGLLIIGIVLISGCVQEEGPPAEEEEEKECEVKEDCADRTCFTKDCINYNCSYSQIISCCGNEICEIGESYENCTDCPNCDDNNTFTEDSFNYTTQECENIDLVVRVGENGIYSSIQEAIDSASNGNIIQVSQGTYLENIIINTSKTLTLQGGWNQEFTSRSEDNSLTVIDGRADASVFDIHADPNATIMLTIEGFTIQNGKAPIQNGKAHKSGGIWIESNGFINVLLINNNISGNTAQNGGGVSIESNGEGFVNVTLINNTISGNIVSEEGGGIRVSSGGLTEVTLIGNVITDNIVTNPFEKPPCDGGGIAVYASGSGVSSLRLTNNLITRNRGAAGGGIWGYAYGPGDALITMVLTNNIIAENRADYGGAIMFAAGKTDPIGISEPGGSVICTLTNNVITANIGLRGSGGIHLHSGSSYGEGGMINLSSQNDIIWGNVAPDIWQLLAIVEGGGSGVATAKASYSDISFVRTSGGGTYTSDHVINANPLFINSNNQFFLLQGNSPCIDAGDPNSIYNDGCIPPAKGTEQNDIGAYGGPNNCYWS